MKNNTVSNIYLNGKAELRYYKFSESAGLMNQRKIVIFSQKRDL